MSSNDAAMLYAIQSEILASLGRFDISIRFLRRVHSHVRIGLLPPVLVSAER